MSRVALGLQALALTFALAAAVLVIPTVALAKSYEITDCTIDSRIAPNGDLAATVHQTFDFDGDFTRVYWTIPKSGTTGIAIAGVQGPDGRHTLTETTTGRPPGTFRVTDEGYQVLVEAFFRLSDTTATFTMRYRALGAVTRWSDVGVLYWKFIGATWDVPMDDVEVSIELPKGVARDEVRAWAHGPLYGTVTIEPDASVVLAVSPLPPMTMVEARVTFPAEALPGALQINQPRLDLILAEEQAWADAANAERERLEKEQQKARQGRWVAVALALLLWAPFFILYFRFGREYTPSLPGGLRRR